MSHLFGWILILSLSLALASEAAKRGTEIFSRHHEAMRLEMQDLGSLLRWSQLAQNSPHAIFSQFSGSSWKNTRFPGTVIWGTSTPLALAAELILRGRSTVRRCLRMLSAIESKSAILCRSLWVWCRSTKSPRAGSARLAGFRAAVFWLYPLDGRTESGITILPYRWRDDSMEKRFFRLRRKKKRAKGFSQTSISKHLLFSFHIEPTSWRRRPDFP